MKLLRLLPIFVTLIAPVMFAGCKTTPEAKPDKKPATTAPSKPLVNTLKDQNGDQAFRAFLGRLRLVVAAHDTETLASMMTTDFGYQLEPPLEGPGVFAYWDERNLWSELQMVIKDRFEPFGSREEAYMVAPAEFAANPTTYTGYRAGIQQINGSWKFAYFVNGQ